jgi:hypothetical protein
MNNEWRPNTLQDPFWKYRGPVEAEFEDGKIRRLGCPGCARGQMAFIVRWRPLPKITTPEELK